MRCDGRVPVELMVISLRKEKAFPVSYGLLNGGPVIARLNETERDNAKQIKIVVVVVFLFDFRCRMSRLADEGHLIYSLSIRHQ